MLLLKLPVLLRSWSMIEHWQFHLLPLLALLYFTYNLELQTYCNYGGSRGVGKEVEPASLLGLVSFSSFSVAADINAFGFCDVIYSAW